MDLTQLWGLAEDKGTEVMFLKKEKRGEKQQLFLLTELKESDITLDPWTCTSAGCYLHTVADPRGQTGNQHGEGWAINCTVDVVPSLIPQAPNLP